MADLKLSNLVFVWITALLYCFNNLESVTFQKNNSDVSYVVKSYTSCMTISLTSVIANLTVLSIVDCVYECAVRQGCKGLNFRRRFGLCQLLAEAGDLQVTPGCLYVQKQDITSNGLCSPHCTDGQSCLPMDKGCTLQECRRPDVQNGEIYGNMYSAGSAVLIRCDTDYLTVSGKQKETSKCRNGKWEPEPTCIFKYNANSVALNKSATQSSTYRSDTEAGKAVDGIWNTSSFSHTDTSGEKIAWWEVDLLTPTRVSSLKILNRKDDSARTVRRLHDITVTVGNSSNPSELCTTYEGPGGSGELVKLNCNSTITGRYVRISKPNNITLSDDNLAMCEVGIY